MRNKWIWFPALFLAVGASVSAIEAFKVKRVSVSVSESEYKGFCPHTFVFTGRITTNREGTVRYTWLRSSGIPRKTYTLVFESAGTKTVTHEWELGGAMGKHEGWARIEILAPNSLLSNQADFELECLPQVRLERKAYRVSGRVIAGGAHADWLEGLQLKVKLVSGARTLCTCTAAFNRDGICPYSLVVFNAPGTYRVTVEPVHPTDPEKFHLCFNGVDPAFITVRLIETAPVAINKNFNLNWSWRHLDMGQEAFDSPCW
ncbi:MAG: hypothetical protein JXO51_10125 [Candidatus Aminicenantes bacterium]|nr:hypothetical protein [Candidatus Aminicenantes bacterium]